MTGKFIRRGAVKPPPRFCMRTGETGGKYGIPLCCFAPKRLSKKEVPPESSSLFFKAFFLGTGTAPLHANRGKRGALPCLLTVKTGLGKRFSSEKNLVPSKHS